MVQNELAAIRNMIKKLEGFSYDERSRIMLYVNCWHEECDPARPENKMVKAAATAAVSDDGFIPDDALDAEDF